MPEERLIDRPEPGRWRLLSPIIVAAVLLIVAVIEVATHDGDFRIFWLIFGVVALVILVASAVTVFRRRPVPPPEDPEPEAPSA